MGSTVDLRHENAEGKSSKHSIPNGGLMVMNPMGSQSVKKSPHKQIQLT